MLSILMPVYNEIATVEQAIEEVLGTELPTEIELIVVDDGSTDGSAELLRSREWPAAVRVFHHDRNAGKGAAVADRARARAEASSRRSSTPTSSTTRPISASCSRPCSTAARTRCSAFARSTVTRATRSSTCSGTRA